MKRVSPENKLRAAALAYASTSSAAAAWAIEHASKDIPKKLLDAADRAFKALEDAGRALGSCEPESAAQSH